MNQHRSHYAQPPYNPQFNYQPMPSPDNNIGQVHREQPYSFQPMTSSNVVYVYDEAAMRRQNQQQQQDGVDKACLTALCASCLCCWLIPPLDCHTIG